MCKPNLNYSGSTPPPPPPPPPPTHTLNPDLLSLSCCDLKGRDWKVWVVPHINLSTRSSDRQSGLGSWFTTILRHTVDKGSHWEQTANKCTRELLCRESLALTFKPRKLTIRSVCCLSLKRVAAPPSCNYVMSITLSPSPPCPTPFHKCDCIKIFLIVSLFQVHQPRCTKLLIYSTGAISAHLPTPTALTSYILANEDGFVHCPNIFQHKLDKYRLLAFGLQSNNGIG